MKTAIFFLAAILVLAPFHAQAGAVPTDQQILQMRKTCKGVQCDFIPLTTVELANPKNQETVIIPTTSSVAEKMELSKSSEKKLKKLDKQIKALEKKLKRLQEKRALLLNGE